MKKSVVALTALLALGLAACSPETSSSTTPPSSSDESSSNSTSKPTQEQNFTRVSISNKDELQAAWYVEAEESRTLNLDIDPATNQINLINSGKLTATSSNTAVAVCTGLGVAGVGVGTATITVTLHNDNGTTLTDTVDVTITNRPVTAVGPQVVTDIKAGTYTFGFLNRSTGKISFITGEMSGFYGECVGVDQYDKAAKIELAASGDGWTMKVVTEGLSSTGKYIGASITTNEKGTHDNFIYQEEPFVWTYDAEKTIFHATVDGKDLFIGGNGNCGTADAYEATEENIAANWYMLPYTFVEGYEKVTAPESGKTYKFGADKTGDPNLASCVTGDMKGYYMVTTTDPEIAMDVTATETDGKWTLKTAADKYIAVTVSGTHYNVVYQDEPFSFTFDEELATFIADVTYDGAPTQAIIGLQGTYDTIGAYNISELDSTFVSHLYNGYYIPTEGPIFTAPEDGVAMKFGAYNDSKANEGYWIFTGEMDGYYLGAVRVTDKATFDAQADVTPHAVGDKWTLEVGTGKYLNASTSTGSDGKTHNNIGIVTDAYEWTYDTEKGAFTTVLNETTYFIGGQKSYDTFSLSDIKYLSDNLKLNLCTWGKLDTTEPEPTPVPAPVTTTIADILDGNTVDGNTVYQITGIIEGRDMDDKYGNAYITDPETGRSIQLYGLSSDMSAFSMDGTTLKYTNLKDAATELTDVANGTKVTLNVQWSAEHNNAYSVYVSHEASTATYEVEVEAGEHGAAVAGTTSGTYGTESIITVTPEEGYRVNTATLTTAYGTSSLAPEADGTYKISITCVNKVAFTFVSTAQKDTSIELTAETLGLSGSYADGTANFNVNGENVAINYNQVSGAKNQMQTNDNRTPNTQIWNTVAIPGTITSIVVTFNDYDVSDAETTGWGVSDTAFGEISAQDAGTELTPISASQVSGNVATIEVADGGSFFTIARIDGGNAAYYASIVINFTPNA